MNSRKENEKALTVLIDDCLHREFKSIISSKGLKMKDCITQLIEEYISKNKK